MTILGKILVYVNVAVSGLVAAFAFALWANRIDLSNAKEVGGDPETAGRWTQRDKELQKDWDNLPLAEANLDEARNVLSSEEQKRWDDRGWYLAEMQHLQGDVTPDNPVKRVEYAAQDDPITHVKKGQVAIDPTTDRPLMKKPDGPALPSMAVADSEYAAASKQVVEAEDKHQEQAFEAMVLTIKISGPPSDEELKNLPEWMRTRLGKVKLPARGITQRLADEKQKQDDLQDELKRLYPLLVNTKVESQLILQRNAALKARLKELQGAKVAVGE
jgi:hypothetical protein